MSKSRQERHLDQAHKRAKNHREALRRRQRAGEALGEEIRDVNNNFQAHVELIRDRQRRQRIVNP